MIHLFEFFLNKKITMQNNYTDDLGLNNCEILNPQKNNFKIVLVGDGGVGKTAFIKRHMKGTFEKKYIATIGVEVHPLVFNTNQGNITFNIWDTAGQEKFGGLRDGYYIASVGCMAFFDVTSRVSFKNVTNWIRNVMRVQPNIPLVLCGNKVDEKDRKIKPKEISAYLQLLKQEYPNVKYYDVSAKTNYNFDKPFLSLGRSFLGENLNFIEGLPKNPIEIEVDFKKFEKELELSKFENELANFGTENEEYDSELSEIEKQFENLGIVYDDENEYYYDVHNDSYLEKDNLISEFAQFERGNETYFQIPKL